MVDSYKTFKLSIFLFIAVIIITVILLIISAIIVDDVNEDIKFSYNSKSDQKTHSYAMVNDSFWQSYDFSNGIVPENIKSLEKEVIVQSKRIDVFGADVFYRTAEPVNREESTEQSVLLLHGQLFTSKNWLDLGTMHFLAASGHKVAAVDLPDFGESAKFTVNSKGEFLRNLIATIALKNVFIVSPSFSGFYSVPYIESYWKEASGYIPVAAIMNESFDKSGPGIKIPTLNIIGELDTVPFGLKTKDHIRHITTSQSVILPGARHPAYLDAPELFHRLLYNFIKEVKKANN